MTDLRLVDLNPYVVDGRVLWFDCPVHRGDPSARCHGEVGVRLRPTVGTDIDHTPVGIPSWAWTGDWTTWTVTLDPSIKMDLLCGAHFSVQRGIVRPA